MLLLAESSLSKTTKILKNTKYLVYISKNVAFSTTNKRRSANQLVLQTLGHSLKK